MINYSYQTALEVAQKLVDRESAELNKKLNEEASELKKAPDASLWTGIPSNLRPKPVGTPPFSNAINTAPNALYSDMIQLNTYQNSGDLNHVSPLTTLDQSRSAQQNNQIFQTAWGHMNPQRPSTRGGGRRRPYNNQIQQRQSQIPPNEQFQSQGRRRPRRGGPNQRGNRQQNQGNDFIGMLRQFVNQY